MRVACAGVLDVADGGFEQVVVAEGDALHEGLIDDAAQGEVFVVGADAGQAGHGPVDGLGLGCLPVEGGDFFGDLAHDVGVEGDGTGGDFGGPAFAVVGGGGVGVGAELVEENPG